MPAAARSPACASSTRRISASAAMPTWSCSRRRLLGRQVALDLAAGRVERLGQRSAVVAVAPGEHLDRDRGAAEADRGARERARPLDQPLQHHRAAGGEQHHRRDQVGAAAVVLLRHRRPDPRPPARRRRSPCARPRGRRPGRGRRGRRSPAAAPSACTAPRAGPSCRSAAQQAGGDQGRRRSRRRTRRSSKGSRAAGIRRRTSGSTAIASTSFSGPRRPGTRAASFGASSGLRSEATSTSPSRSPHRGRPVRRPVDQQAVAQGHPTESQLLLAHSSDDRDVPAAAGDRPLEDRGGGTSRAGRRRPRRRRLPGSNRRGDGLPRRAAPRPGGDVADLASRCREEPSWKSAAVGSSPPSAPESSSAIDRVQLRRQRLQRVGGSAGR